MISPLGVESQTPHVADFGAHRDCSSATRAHFMPRTVFAASATAFSAAFAKLSLDVPTTSITFCAIAVLLLSSTGDCTAPPCTARVPLGGYSMVQGVPSKNEHTNAE